MADDLKTYRPSSGWDRPASEAAGRFEAERGRPVTQQRPDESSAAWQNREAAYRNNNKS